LSAAQTQEEQFSTIARKRLLIRASQIRAERTSYRCGEICCERIEPCMAVRPWDVDCIPPVLASNKLIHRGVAAGSFT